MYKETISWLMETLELVSCTLDVEKTLSRNNNINERKKFSTSFQYLSLCHSTLNNVPGKCILVNKTTSDHAPCPIRYDVQ